MYDQNILSSNLVEESINKCMNYFIHYDRLISHCNTIFYTKSVKHYCSDNCKLEGQKLNRINKKHPLHDRELEFLLLYNELKSMNKALKMMGFIGAQGGYYDWAKNVLKNSNVPDNGLLNHS